MSLLYDETMKITFLLKAKYFESALFIKDDRGKGGGTMKRFIKVEKEITWRLYE